MCSSTRKRYAYKVGHSHGGKKWGIREAHSREMLTARGNILSILNQSIKKTQFFFGISEPLDNARTIPESLKKKIKQMCKKIIILYPSHPLLREN